MPARHVDVPGALYFITQVTHKRYPLLCAPWGATLLLENLRQTKQFHPFRMLAYVVLPDHFHLLIRPGETATLSSIMASVKANFSKDYRAHEQIAGRVDIWQRGYWDHIIRNDDDFESHLRYIHYNPVHHGLALHPEDWRYSSFAEWKRRGVYPAGWGWEGSQDLEWFKQAAPEIEGVQEGEVRAEGASAG